MRRYIILCAALLAVLLAAPATWPALADDTPTPTATDTPTSTATATATSTATGTPAIVVTGVTSNNQGFEVRRYISAGDIALFMIWLIGIGLFVFLILLDQTKSRG